MSRPTPEEWQADMLNRTTEALESIAASMERLTLPLITLTPPTVPAASMEPDERDLVHQDIVAILGALGIGDHARPYSTHEVVVREIIPEIEALRRWGKRGGGEHITSTDPGQCRVKLAHDSGDQWVLVRCEKHTHLPPHTHVEPGA